MRIYLQISGQKSVDVDNLSPFQVRILLQKVLTVSEWASEEKYVVNFLLKYDIYLNIFSPQTDNP